MKADVDHKAAETGAGTVDRLGGRAPASGASILGSRLFIKYVALFVSVVVLALVANGAFEVWFSFQEQKAALTNLQHRQAEAAADKIEEFVTQIQSQLGWTTQLPWTNGTLDQRRFDALRLLRQVPAITELAQIDASGHEQLKVSRLTMDVVGSGIDYSDKPEFKEAVKNKVYYGPVYFRRESEPYMTIALAGARVENGVSIAQVNLKLIWDVVSGIKVGENGHAYVVDGDGRLIAHPDISLVLRNTDMSKLAQVQAARAGGSGEDVQEADNLAGHKVLTAYAPVHPLGWFVFVETPIQEAYAPLYRSVQRSGYVLFGALVLAFVAGAFLARRMVVPIQALRAGAARIGAGDLGQRIDIKTGDEVEALADQFNAMAGQLQESYADLEKKVDDRTRELSESLEQQTATAEVLGAINASRGDLQPVFEAMVEKARRLCEADAGHLALPVGDDYRSVAVSAMSPEMERTIRSVSYAAGRGTAIGRALAERRPVQISDIAADNEHVARHAADKGFIRTILGVPLLREGEAIGAFGLSRQRVEPFSERQIGLVRTFAEQAVIAIENTRLLTELRESLEQQTATADVLGVISSSQGELQPVFQAMLENATRICEASFGLLQLHEGGAFRTGAMHNVPAAFVQAIAQRGPLLHPGPLHPLARVIAAKQLLHIFDFAEDPAYKQREPAAVRLVELAGARSLIAVPMLKENELIGVIVIYRTEVRPFTDKQIALVENFAAQAVIAIENARLLSELRQSLEQQTATADVLRVISASPGDLEPVFSTMLENATRICQAEFGVLSLREGAALRVVAMHNPPSAYAELRRREPTWTPTGQMGHILAQAVAGKRAIQVPDLAAYGKDDPLIRDFSTTTGARSLIAVPLLKEGEVIGISVIYRQEVRPFSDKQIELLTNFAAQVVIAIENARLLNELRESLEQQTATSEVLRVISSSPGELEPVFQVILENATRICEAKFGHLQLHENGAFLIAAMYNTPLELAEFLKRQGPHPPTPGSPLDHVMRTKRLSHVADIAVEGVRGAAGRLGGARSIICVPMLKDELLIGTITIYRQDVHPFTDKQIALLTNFAAQAVIAIENARLLNELRQSLEQQTATSEVLRVISSSPGDLEPVFQAMLENAVRICGAKFGNLFLSEDDAYRAVAVHGPPAYVEQWQRDPVIPMRENRGVPLDRLTSVRDVIQILDLSKEQAYIENNPRMRILVDQGGARTMLLVPMLKDGELIGAFVIYRQEVLAFADKQIALVQNFAAQAVIAIENTRLLNELRQRTSDLSKSLQDLRTAQDRLVQSQKLASLGQLTAGIAHEIKNPLNFVNNFSSLSVELIDELNESLGQVQIGDKLRDDIAELSATLRGNMEKIVQHGKRADSIVKNMLLHSREGSGEHREVEINAIVEEALNLAYHGARAEKQGFNITLERAFDPAAGQVDIYPQEVTRVLLNLITNGFYAASKRKGENGDGGYEPTLSAVTKDLGDCVEIRIRDNGTGIPAEVKEKMFNPFFTTKPAGEGTGLGLSISHDIIVKQHSGTIEVDTRPGEFTEFRIVLPRAAAFPIPSGGKA